MASRESKIETSQGVMPLRFFYFFSFGALGAFFPFLPLLLSKRGLDPQQISWVLALVPLSAFLVPPIWGSLADKLRSRLLLLRLASLGCAAAVLLLIPSWGLLGSFVAVGAVSFFRAPITSLADAATCEILGQTNINFGRIRVWGSVGFVLFTLSLGLLSGSEKPVLLLIVVCAAYTASALSTAPMATPPMQVRSQILRQSRQFLSRPTMLTFLAANALYYMGHGTYDAFFALHAKNLGYGDAFVGLSWAIGVTVEIAVMVLAPRFLHLTSSTKLLVFCAICAVLRWLLLSVITHSVALCAVQAFHGITFGLWYLCIVKYIQERAPNHLRTSLQSIAMACIGFGMVIGYLAGGAILHNHGGQLLYLCAAAATAASVLLYLKT